MVYFLSGMATGFACEWLLKPHVPSRPVYYALSLLITFVLAVAMQISMILL